MPKIYLNVFSYGGIKGQTQDCLWYEQEAARKWSNVKFRYRRISEDALISRSRSRAASMFLQETDDDVLFMLDHDIQWRIGNIIDTCQIAVEKNAVVGGLYSKRRIGSGLASRIKKDKIQENESLEIGAPGLVEADYVSTGFMAIPRGVLQDVVDKWPGINRVSDVPHMEYWDIFSCLVTDHTIIKDKKEYLSEDWAFCKRVHDVGHKCYVSTMPFLVHYGDHGFTVEDAMNIEYAKKRLEAGIG